MGSKPFLKLLGLDRPELRNTIGVENTIEAPRSSEPTCNECGLDVSKTHHTHAPPPPPVARTARSPKSPMRYLPHTLITSNLGCWYSTSRLQFNHLLTEDPSIAVFSTEQWAPVPRTWRNRQRDICLFPITRLTCDAKVVVGAGWQYEVSKKAIRYWNSKEGVMLVDWHMLYSSYFTQANKTENRKTVGMIVERYRNLEGTTLRTETGGAWSTYGEWNIHPATRAEVALACKHEGRGFERGLSPKRKMRSVDKLKTRVDKLAKGVKEVLRKGLEKKWSKPGQRIEKLESYGGYGVTIMPGYQMLS